MKKILEFIIKLLVLCSIASLLLFIVFLIFFSSALGAKFGWLAICMLLLAVVIGVLKD
jgi:hypothetical protein